MVFWCSLYVEIHFNSDVISIQFNLVSAGTSTASTVPAGPDSVEKSKGNGARGSASSPQISTPKPRVKRSLTADSASSAPKLSRAVQSKQVLEMKQQRSPTVHYSPTKVKKTAVKAKAKTKSKKAGKDADSPPAPKLETPSPTRARAVQAALQRQCTSEITTSKAPKEETTKKANPPPKPDPKGKAKVAPAKPDSSKSSHSDDSSSEASGGFESDQELSLEVVQERKKAHARYMRFSRSMRSRRALSIFIS